MKVDWIKKTKEGIQVKDGSFFVDPIYPVKKAIITHGHADHARAGHEHVIATLETLEIMKERYGNNFCKKTLLVLDIIISGDLPNFKSTSLIKPRI